jgi:hypothetical protein
MLAARISREFFLAERVFVHPAGGDPTAAPAAAGGPGEVCAAAVLLLIVLLFIVQAIVVTQRERIRDRLDALIAAVAARTRMRFRKPSAKATTARA